MSIIYVLIPIAVLLTAIGIYLFFWAVKTEQFDDLEKQGLSILFDEEPAKQAIAVNESKSNTETVNNEIDINATTLNKAHDEDNINRLNK